MDKKKIIFLLFLFITATFPLCADKCFLDVPYWGQTMEWPWGGDFQGDSRALISDNGCMMVSAAMMLKYYGVNIDPRILNRLLLANNGYTPFNFRGTYIGKISFDFNAPVRLFKQVTKMRIYGAFDSPADVEMIKKEIKAGHPVIAIVRFQGIYNHGVVVYGYNEDILYIHDPIDKRNTTLNSAYTDFNDKNGCCLYKNILGAVVYYNEG